MKHDAQTSNSIYQEINAELSFLDNRPSLYYKIMPQIKGLGRRRVTVRKPLIVPVFLFAILLMSSVAFAASILLNSLFEKAIDMETEKGSFYTWEIDEKIMLIDLLWESGWSFAESDVALLHDEQFPSKSKEDLVDQLINEGFGRVDAFSHIDIIEKVKGPMSTWSLEDKAWYSNYIRTKKTLIDSWQDVLPDEGDLSRDTAIAIAKAAILEAHPITEEELDGRIINVNFFINDKHPEPRWLVSWLTDPYGSSEYVVLMTRSGEIIEDVDLGIHTPEHMAQLMKQPPEDALPPESVYPTGRREQWSIVDKAMWLGTDNGIPSAHDISEEEAIKIAQQTVYDNGYDLDDYEICVWYKLYDYYNTSDDALQEPYYVVYFIDNFDAPMNSYAIFIDPQTGVVFRIVTPNDSGNNG